MAIAKVFFDIDMRLGIDGFEEILKRKKVTLRANEFAMFMNRKQTYIKIYWGGHYILNYRKGKQISVEDIKSIPEYFKREIMSANIERQIQKFIGDAPQVHVDESGLRAS